MTTMQLTVLGFLKRKQLTLETDLQGNQYLEKRESAL